MSARREAVEAMRGQPYKRIARDTGVPLTTVKRWLDPEFAQRQRELSSAAKRKRKGSCACGASLAYDNSGGVCTRCRNAARRIWTRESIIDAIQRFASVHGRPPVATEWVRADKDNGYPATSNVGRSTCNRSAPFEQWADAIEAAGFPRPRKGRYSREGVYTDEVRARLSAGQKRRWARQRGEIAA